MTLKCIEEKKSRVYSFVCSFVCRSTRPSIQFIHPSSHSSKKYLMVWFFSSHIYTWLVPRPYKGWDLRMIKCPGSTSKCNLIQQISLNLSSCQMSVSLDAVPYVCPYTCLSLCLGSGSTALLLSPLFSSAFSSPEFKRAPYGKITALCESWCVTRKENQSVLVRILLFCDIPLQCPHRHVILSLKS